jgi:prevent-host-death family protein
MKSVGSYELKTHLTKFLKLVMEGEVIEITLHGKPVAKILPSNPSTKHKKDSRSISKRLKDIRAGQTLGPDLTIRDLIDEGRRF